MSIMGANENYSEDLGRNFKFCFILFHFLKNQAKAGYGKVLNC